MITLQWETTETTRDGTDGGDTLETTIGELEIDATVTEVTDITAEITEHPVEEGINITDHVRPGLLRVSLECVVTNTPIYPRVPGASVGALDIDIPGYTVFTGGAVKTERSRTEGRLASQISVRVLQFANEFDRPLEVVEQLRELIHSGKRVDILGLRLGDLEGWLLVNMSPEIGATDSVRFTLTAQELRTAVTEEVEAPSPRVERGRSARPQGQQAGSLGAAVAEVLTGEESAAHAAYSAVSAAAPGVFPGLR